MQEPLPPVTGDVNGWPWDSETDLTPVQTQPAATWPRITVVTPSFNQGRFLEAAIRSVLRQGYPNLEYIVIDGGSSDDSTDILHRYNAHLDNWISEADDGQSTAINKGFSKSSGEILAWLNSDDMYAPGALHCVGAIFRDSHAAVVSGNAVFTDAEGRPEQRFDAAALDLRRLLRVRGGFTAPQQSTFFSRACWERHGPLSEDLHYLMDTELWIKMAAAKEPWRITNKDLAFFRHHPAQKTADLSTNLALLRERDRMLERFAVTPYCRPCYRRDVRRGLRENRVKQVRVAFLTQPHDCRYRPYLIRAAIRHPECLLVPAFYGMLILGIRAPLQDVLRT